MEMSISALSFGTDSAGNNTENTSQEYTNTYRKIEKMEDFFRYFTYEYDALHKIITIIDNSPEYSDCDISVPEIYNGYRIVDTRDTAIHEDVEGDDDADFPEDEPEIYVDNVCDELGNINLSNAPTQHNAMDTHSESSANTIDIKDIDMLNKVFYADTLVGCDTTIINAIRPDVRCKHLILRGSVRNNKEFPYLHLADNANPFAFEKVMLVKDTSHIFEDMQNNPAIRTLTFAKDSPIDIRNIESTSEMFANLKYIEEINLEGFNLNMARKLRDLSGMFRNCQNLKKVTFGKDNSITKDLFSDRITASLNMSKMFQDCPNLEEVDLTAFDMLCAIKRSGRALDLDSVLYCKEMFSGCGNLKTVKTFIPKVLDQFRNNG